MKEKIFIITILFFSPAIFAAEGWQFTVNAGGLTQPTYEGSDEYYIAPVAWPDAVYAQGNMSYSFSLLNGIGLAYLNESNRLYASATVKNGAERDSEEYTCVILPVDHSDKTKTLLKDTPTALAPVIAQGTLGYMTPLGMIGVTVSYYPTTVDYSQKERDDKFYNAITNSFFFNASYPILNNLVCSGTVSLDLMDEDYADAWYSVNYETEKLDTFDANASIKDVAIQMQLTYMVSPKIGISLLGAEEIMLMDAKDSPYTTNAYQTALALYTFYAF